MVSLTKRPSYLRRACSRTSLPSLSHHRKHDARKTMGRPLLRGWRVQMPKGASFCSILRATPNEFRRGGLAHARALDHSRAPPCRPPLSRTSSPVRTPYARSLAVKSACLAPSSSCNLAPAHPLCTPSRGLATSRPHTLAHPHAPAVSHVAPLHPRTPAAISHHTSARPRAPAHALAVSHPRPLAPSYPRRLARRSQLRPLSQPPRRRAVSF